MPRTNARLLCDERSHRGRPSGERHFGRRHSGRRHSGEWAHGDRRLDERRAGERARRGVTLLELLIVILIVLMITAFTIPVVAPAIQGRRVREGARMFSTFLNAARNRAIETGRPAGVWLERMPAYPEAVSNIYMAEVPPLYGGDFQDSRCVDVVVNKSGQCAGGGVVYRNATDQDWWNVIIPRSRSTIMADIWANPDPNEQNIVRDGDLIKFEGSEYMYTLRTVKMSIDGHDGAGNSKLWWYILRGRNTNQNAEGTHNLGRDASNNWHIHWHDERINFGDWGPHFTANGVFDYDAVGRKYQIIRQPSKMASGGMQLPEGVVLDLNYSGMSDGTLASNVITTTSAVDAQFVGSMPFHPHREENDKTLNPYWGDPIYPNDQTPILIVFSSGGNVDRLYCQSYVWTRTQFSWQGINPWGPIYFLTGKLDKIFPGDIHRSTMSANDAFEMQSKRNWQDFENLWVTIDPLTGLISTSIVDDVADTGNDPGLIANPANVRWARLSASRSRRNVGGR
jgi:prepilin-type N-terminal cleavage/methylation domain-containing protein